MYVLFAVPESKPAELVACGLIMMRPDCKSAVAICPFYHDPSRNSEMGDPGPGHLKAHPGLGLPVSESESWTQPRADCVQLEKAHPRQLLRQGCVHALHAPCLFRTLAVESGESQRNVLILCGRGSNTAAFKLEQHVSY